MIWHDDGGDYERSEQEPPTYMGEGTTEASRYLGSLIACEGDSETIYWHDPDGYTVGKPGFRHYIWVAGAWQRVNFVYFHPSEIRRKGEQQRGTRNVLVHLNVEIGPDGSVEVEAPLIEEV